jgi:hypothetical protein
VSATACSSKEFTDAAGSGGTSSGPPANVSGIYTVALTNRQNTCGTVADWVEGEMTTDIKLDVMQDGADITGNVQGLVGAWLALLIGTADFEGTVHGSAFTLTAYGTKSSMQGNCTLTLNSIIDATLIGNSISGTVTYKPAISTNPDCAPYDCEAVQELSGSRPPPAGG